jgi:hypothetical protein
MMVNLAAMAEATSSPSRNRQRGLWAALRHEWPGQRVRFLLGIAAAVTATIVVMLLTGVGGVAWRAIDAWRDGPGKLPATSIVAYPGSDITSVSFTFEPDYRNGAGNLVNRIRMDLCSSHPFYRIHAIQLSPQPRDLIDTVVENEQQCDTTHPVIQLQDGELVEIGIGAGGQLSPTIPISYRYRLLRVGNDTQLIPTSGTPEP